MSLFKLAQLEQLLQEILVSAQLLDGQRGIEAPATTRISTHET